MKLQEEKRLRNIIRKGIQLIFEKKIQEEQRLRNIIQNLIKEVQTEKFNPTPLILHEKNLKTIHASTGINELSNVLDMVYKPLKDAYMGLTTDPDQRNAFLKTWEWFMKELMSGDIKRRNIAMKAVAKIDKEGFKDSEEVSLQEKIDVKIEDDESAMKVDDELKLKEPIEIPSEEEIEEKEVEDLVSTPFDMDAKGPEKALQAIKQVQNTILRGMQGMKGQDLEDYYKWFFINMLGGEKSGFADVTTKPVVGHFEEAEKELQVMGVETSPDLLPPPEEMLSPKEREY